jgi:uncharacterized membrane protein
MGEKDESKDAGYGITRILALTDGVFGIAATLLVIELVVPTLSAGATSADLWNALAGESHTFLAYLLSFFILGVWWNAHHRHYGLIRDTDWTLRWLNLLLLLWIALLPFFTKILAEYGDLQVALALYSLDQAAAGLFLTLSWIYASRNHRLIDKDVPERTIRLTLIRSSTAPLLFFVSIGVSFIDPILTYISWFGLVPIIIILYRFRQKNEKQYF